MKGLKVSCVLLAVVLLTNIFLVMYVRTTVEELLELVDTAYENILYGKDYSGEYVTDICLRLEDSLTVMRIVINHGEIDEIESCLKRISGAVSAKSDDAVVYLNELRFHIDNLYEREMLSIGNIF